MAESFVEPGEEQVGKLTSSPGKGPIVMVNLLRFKDRADGLDAGVSGLEAYGRYGAGVAPFLDEVGARILVAVDCEESIIGPEAAEWDTAVLVEYPSREAFLKMVTDPAYQKIAAHRTAAVEDSRLILSQLVFAAGDRPAP